METSHAPSAPGFDPLGNPVPMGEAPGNTSRSYRREGRMGAPNAARDLDWYEWLDTQPQSRGSSIVNASSMQHDMRASTGMESLSHALQNGSRTPVNLPSPGSFASLSQRQLHQTSTHRTMGPAAQGFFRVQRRTSTAASGWTPSAESTMRLGTGGRMQQRLSSGRRSAPLPKPSWQRNRRKGGLSPLRASRDAMAAPHQRSRGHLSQPSHTKKGPISSTEQDLALSSSGRPSSADSNPNVEFDNEYSRKTQVKKQLKELLAEGEALLKQFKETVSDHDANKDALNESTDSQNHTGLDTLAESSAAFQKALGLEANNLNARSGLKRVESLMATERRKLRKLKCLGLFKKRYGENWREMMALDREQSDKDLKEVFSMVDEDGSGLLEREEVALVCEFFAGDKEVTDQDIDNAMGQMDQDGSGEVDFEEFLAWWNGRKSAASTPKVEPVQPRKSQAKERNPTGSDPNAQMQSLSSRDDFDSNLKDIFKRYDDDGSGEVDAGELMEIMQSLGVSATEQEINAMVSEIDSDGSGTIDFDEFKTMVHKAMEDGSGRGSKLAMAMVQHSFAAMGDEVKYKWARGTIIRLPNGLYAPVFSEDNLATAKQGGAEVPSCQQG